MITSGKLVTSKEFLILRKTLSCVPSKMNYLEIWPKEENEVTFCGRVTGGPDKKWVTPVKWSSFNFWIFLIISNAMVITAIQFLLLLCKQEDHTPLSPWKLGMATWLALANEIWAGDWRASE